MGNRDIAEVSPFVSADIRGQKVMLDSDLAQLYGVETAQLKRQVRRNRDRYEK